MNKISYTFYLFARPSFIEGYGRLLDVGGSFNVYNESQTAEEADSIALHTDWLTVGLDIKKAIEKHESLVTNE